ncbi:MAG: hypothetical protein AAF108_04915 [Planctomycetota bacterium]
MSTRSGARSRARARTRLEPKARIGVAGRLSIGLSVGLSVGLVGSLGGCLSAKAKGSSKANYELRQEREALLERVTELEAQVAELGVKLEAAAGSENARGLSADALAALPAVASVELVSTSGFRRDGTLAVLVKVSDGRLRAVPATGSLRVDLLRDTGTDLERVAGRSLSAQQVRDAYRSGLAGVAYEVRFPADELIGLEQLVVVASFDDALTGASFEASDVFRRRSASASASNAGVAPKKERPATSPDSKPHTSPEPTLGGSGENG